MIKVLIVDSQELFRESLKVVLSVNPDFEVTDAVSGVPEALISAKRNCPDVVLMDIQMPGTNGVEGTRMMKDRFPHVKVIILTTFDDDGYVFGALKYGASGYLLKGNSLAELSNAIQIACQGGAMINPNIATKAIRLFSQMAKNTVSVHADKALLKELRKNELEIIRAVGRGLSNKEIALELCLSEGTVRNALSIILSKLNLRDRTQLAIWAIQSGAVNGGMDVK